MAAFTSGADWSFHDLPGQWNQEDVDAQLHAEAERTHQNANKPTSDSTAQPDAQHRDDSSKPGRKRTHYPPRMCRICLEVVLPTFHTEDQQGSILPESMRPAPRVTYESPPGDGGRLIRPCHCKGTQKYVHEECLGAWRRQDPLQKRNYWECPTCRYRYHLQRLTWGRWLSSTLSQILLTLFIFFSTMFLLGFVADPIINFYLEPLNTIATAGGPRGSLFYEDEPATWTEHFIKGLASLGLLGFAKFLLTLSPWHWFNMRDTGIVVHRSGAALGGTGRNRLQGLSWFTIALGVATFLYTVWKGVRAWSRRMLEQAGERVMDVPGADDDDDDEE